MTEAWEARLMKLYGLREGEYDERLAAQGGVCLLCGKRPGRVRLVVDHDHQTMVVRGLVHSRCNRAIAPFESSVESMALARDYLTEAMFVRLTGTVPHG